MEKVTDLANDTLKSTQACNTMVKEILRTQTAGGNPLALFFKKEKKELGLLGEYRLYEERCANL